jgi:hypothetical protein
MYYCADNQAQAYEESWDVIIAIPTVRGFGFVHNDVFGFMFTASLVVNEEVTFITRNKQVRIDKITGTGEEIQANEYVYATLATNFQSVTANPIGVIGTDYYFVGKAKKDALASDTTVLVDFWGDEYNHADRAA